MHDLILQRSYNCLHWKMRTTSSIWEDHWYRASELDIWVLTRVRFVWVKCDRCRKVRWHRLCWKRIHTPFSGWPNFVDIRNTASKIMKDSLQEAKMFEVWQKRHWMHSKRWWITTRPMNNSWFGTSILLSCLKTSLETCLILNDANWQSIQRLIFLNKMFSECL